MNFPSMKVTRARCLAKTRPRVQGTRMQIAYCLPSPCGGSAIFSNAKTMLPVLDRRNFPAGPCRVQLMPPIAASHREGGRASSTAAAARAGASTLAVPAEVSPSLACLKLLRAVPWLMCQVSAPIGPYLRQRLRLPATRSHQPCPFLRSRAGCGSAGFGERRSMSSKSRPPTRAFVPACALPGEAGRRCKIPSSTSSRPSLEGPGRDSHQGRPATRTALRVSLIARSSRAGFGPAVTGHWPSTALLPSAARRAMPPAREPIAIGPGADTSHRARS